MHGESAVFIDPDPCDYHHMAQEMSASEHKILTNARAARNIQIFGDRLYFDEHGALRLHPPDHIDDS